MARSELAVNKIVAAAAELCLAAVVAQLAQEGIPATGYSIPPDESPNDTDGAADGWVDIPDQFTTRHYGPDLDELGLWWNSVLVWRIHTSYSPNS
ncbi:hypothetical protein CLM62_08095 [Streptomyces sp. SA15]|uniref:hypothetical protein n=1 Tax=Streptomyces sp. SA15 TaxID=934019 RepID=UPI000BAF5ADB|nr:hypothetical protein [Streptomyces sp. SA15]PAZ16508.1 hypothetical protein CLM62_08095 [Streptomyces sp. SA15]